MENLLALVISYFLGSIPTAYIAARTLKGIDVTKVGSKTVGGANIWHTVSRKASVFVSLADIAKGALAVVLAKVLNLGLPLQISCGLLVILAHNWSPLLRFKGGRGMACAGGMLLVVSPLMLLAVSPLVILGMLLRNLAIATVVSTVFLPLLAWVITQNSTLTLGLAGIPLLMIIKRITANWESFAPGRPAYSVLIYRILLDRDILDREAWVKRNVNLAPGNEKTDFHEM